MEEPSRLAIRDQAPLLIVFSGLPGTGKTTLSRTLAQNKYATYLRIDTIEQALRDANPMVQSIGEEGYGVACALAEDNLRPGRTVIADAVNPCAESRDAWLAVAQRVQADTIEVEVICSDPSLHRERVEKRLGDIRGLVLPTWEKVLAREYEPWTRPHLVIDTAGRSVTESVEELDQKLAALHKAWKT